LLRKATIKDVEKMWKLINSYADRHLMLPRSLSELYENLRDFFVLIEDGQLVGCGALHITWEDCGEVLSLAVDPSRSRQGIGSSLLKACEEDARTLGLSKIFTLTYVPEFFEKHGFVRVEKSSLPHKIWSMCIKCPKFPDCDEVPLVKEINGKLTSL
jgi:amino-acid N-acetyltransferase